MARKLSRPTKFALRPLRLRPPIEPSLRDVRTPENHPLWQFFDEKRQFVRPADELTNIGEAWSVPQLRRKSFEDLHTLWYVSLREFNRLSRESRVINQMLNGPSQDTDPSEESTVFEEVKEKVHTTMWRIRHVLSERYHGFRRTEVTFDAEYERVFNEFRDRYLGADANADAEMSRQLERFQYAFFGINPQLEDNWPNEYILRGLFTVAQLKLTRFAYEQDQVKDVRDVREAFLLFGCQSSPEGVAETIKTIIEIRETPAVPKDQELEVLAELMHSTATTADSSTVTTDN